MSRNKLAYLLAVLLGIGVLIIVVLLFYTQSRLTSSLTSQPLAVPSPADKKFPLQTVEFVDEKAMSSLAVEFLEKPRTMGLTYIVKATVPIGEQTTQFDVVLGGTDGQSRSGSCDYDKNTSTFTGNNTFFHESTTQVAGKIQPGVRALLQVYHANDPQVQKTIPNLVAMDTIMDAATKNKSLTGAISIVPEEICIANPI